MGGDVIHFFNYSSVNGVKRKLTVIDGVPFYCSSGTSSESPETWFPFLGLDISFKNCGWFRKPGFLDDLSSLLETVSKYDQFFLTDDLKKRFTSLKCLIISSKLGGGFWETKEGQCLLSCLREDYCHFYQTTYELRESNITFAVENIPDRSPAIKKVYREINSLLEKGAKHSLSDCDPSLFLSNFEQFGFVSELCPIPVNNVVSIKLEYPEFPKKLSPTLYSEMIWPCDFETSLTITKEQKEETELFIRAVYPIALDEISTDVSYRDYSCHVGQNVGLQIDDNKTYLNIKILNNGEIIVYPALPHYIYQKPDKGLVIFKVYNLSHGEWQVLKNEVNQQMIPYLKVLGDRPHIAKLSDFTGFGNRIAQIEKYYDMNCTQLLTSKFSSISIAQKEKFIQSLLDGLNAIHQTPYRFDKTSGYLAHSDIKFENLFYDEQTDDFVIGDLGETGKWQLLHKSSCFISPELAIELLRFEARNYSANHIVYFNKIKGQAIDIWNLGLVFAGILGGIVNHETYNNNVFFPDLKFILDRLQFQEYESLFLGYIAELEQEEIDHELNQIIQAIPKTDEGMKLRRLWELTQQMLQVSYQKRPSCRELIKQMQTNPLDQVTIAINRYNLFSKSTTHSEQQTETNRLPDSARLD